MKKLETIEEVKSYVLKNIEYHYSHLKEIENKIHKFSEICDAKFSYEYHENNHNAFAGLAYDLGISDKVKEIHDKIDGKYTKGSK